MHVGTSSLLQNRAKSPGMPHWRNQKRQVDNFRNFSVFPGIPDAWPLMPSNAATLSSCTLAAGVVTGALETTGSLTQACVKRMFVLRTTSDSFPRPFKIAAFLKVLRGLIFTRRILTSIGPIKSPLEKREYAYHWIE